MQRQKLPQLESVHPHEDGLRLRLFFPSSESEEHGLVDLHFVEDAHHLRLHCRLPVSSSPAAEIILQPQSLNLDGEVQSVGERKLSHDALDALYVIRSEREELDLLALLEGPLMGLARFSARIEIRGEEVEIHLPGFEEEGVDWSILFDEISALWQNVERYHQGWRPEETEALPVDTQKILRATKKRRSFHSPLWVSSHRVFMVLWFATMGISWSVQDLSWTKMGLRDAAGIRTGPWHEWHKNGQKRSEGGYKDGERDGKWTMWDIDGQKYVEGSYKNGQPWEGKWTRYMGGGIWKREEGSYKNGVKEGKWTEWSYPNGSTHDRKESIGSYKNGVKEGQWTKWEFNGQKKYEGSYKNGQPWDGKWTMWYNNGQKESIGNYKNGKNEGKWTKWHTNGQKESFGNYKNGQRDGKWTEWDIDGQKKYEGSYKDGKEQGEWTWWNSAGKKTKENVYKEGQRIKAKTY